MTQEQLRILTYVLLGMTLGVSVMLVALFIDVHISSSLKTVPATEQAAPKGDSTDGSHSTGTE